MPPTVNSAYTGKDIRVKSDSYNLFESTCYYWCMQHQKQIKKARKFFEANKSLYIFVWAYKFEAKKILNKSIRAKGPVSILDTSNRIKVIEDYVSDLVDIDDSYIFDHMAMKRLGNNTVDVYALDITKNINDELMAIRNLYATSLTEITEHIKAWNEKSQTIT